jgi:hypothetical protein
MGKLRASIEYRPDPNDPEEMAIHRYLKKRPEGVSGRILGLTKMVEVANAILEDGNPDPSKAMCSILDLSREIDRIYTEYQLAGINLPSISRTYGFGSMPTVDRLTPPQSSNVGQIHVVPDDEDDDDSWDEIPRRPVMPEPDYDLDS